MLQTNELTVIALRCKNECWNKYIKLIYKIKAYFFMNAVFKDNGMCLVVWSFLKEEQLEHSEVLEQLS